MSRWKNVGAVGLSAVMLLSGVVPAAAAAGPETADAAVEASVQVKSKLVVPDTVPLETSLANSAASDAPTDAKIEKDEAIALARKLANVPDDYALQGIFYNANMATFPQLKRGPTWNVTFDKTVQDRYFGSINVTLDADTGRLLQFSRSENDPDKKPVFPPKTDLEEAKRIALAYLQQTNPDEMKETRYNESFEKNFKTPLDGDVRYHIQYDRTANGIPYPQNFISAEISGDGEIVGYQLNWDPALPFESPESVIGLEKATAIMAEKADLYLSYLFAYEPGQGKERKLMTAYQARLPFIDAKSGELWSFGGKTQTAAVQNRTPLTSAPLGEAPKPAGPITKEQAIKTVTAVFPLPEGAKLEKASYSEQKDSYDDALQSEWHIRWTVSDDERDAKGSLNTIWASVDGTSGEIRSFNRNDKVIMGKEKPDSEAVAAYKLSFEEAKEKAIAFVKSIVPYYTNQLYLENETSDELPAYKLAEMAAFRFRFGRIIDGVEAGYEGINVGIDRKTGEVSYYNNGFSTADYPLQKPQTIPVEQARSLLFSLYDIELQYLLELKGGSGYPIPFDIPPEKYNALVAAGEIKPEDGGELQVKLVYVPVPKYGSTQQNEIFLDAASGEWKQRSNGEPARLERPQATDIKGHKAEKELRMMVEYEALALQNGKVNPEQAMSRGEMIKMLVIAMNGGNGPIAVSKDRAASFSDVSRESPYFAYVESAVDLKLIDRDVSAFNPDAKMTREDMAKLIVRALGYHRLAQVPELFALHVSDADRIGEKGSAAIVLSLGIMPAKDGAFQPAAEVTRADAAAAFYRYLQKRAELQDRSPYYGW